MVHWLRRLASAVSTGYIFTFFSELSFWARPTDGTTLPGAISLLLPYTFGAYVFLLVVTAFRVRRPAAIFLSGVLFGWLIEGVFVQTAYNDLPLSISFTGLAWHALITVMVGWWALQRAMRMSVRRTIGLSALVGAVYGLWATAWWREAPPATPLPDFALYALCTTLLLVAAYCLTARLLRTSFVPSRLEQGLLLLAIVAYVALVTVPRQPLALVVLPPLVALIVAALWWNRRWERRADALALLYPATPVPIGPAICLLALPVAATSVYGLLLALQVRVPAAIILYLVTTPLGFLALLASVGGSLRARNRAMEMADLTS